MIMIDDTWFLAAQEELRPLEEKVRQTLVGAGYHEYDRERDADTPGFMVSSITPSWGLQYVEIQHVDRDGADVRPMIASYAAALEAAFVQHTVEYEQPKGPYPYGLADIHVPFRTVPFDLKHHARQVI